MGRRRIDWIQFTLLLITIVGALLHVESRISKVEQHLTDQDRDNVRMHEQLNRIETALRR